MKRCLFDGWLGTDDGKGYLAVPGALVDDDAEIVAQHPEQFEDVPEQKPAEEPPAEPEPDPTPAAPAKAVPAKKAAPAAGK